MRIRAAAFYPRWIVACSLAQVVGIGSAAAVASGMRQALGEPDSTPGQLIVLAAMVLAGAIEGGALGWLEWRLLRERLPALRIGEWVGITVAVSVSAWLVGMAGPLFGDTPGAAGPSLGAVFFLAALAGAGVGALFGIAQWLVLRRHAERAHRWIAIHVPGWALAMGSIFFGASLPDTTWPIGAIALVGAGTGLVGGALLGATTGLVARTLRPWVEGRSLRGRVYAVTGATSGIGFEIAAGLARRGATVALLCRSVTRGADACRSIGEELDAADVHTVFCDLAVLDSVRTAAAEIRSRWPRLDGIVHAAGETFPRRAMTEDGIEATLAVDVVGPFLLTTLLGDRLEAVRGRVVTLTGIYQRRARVDLADLHFSHRPYGPWAANAQAQRARMLFTTELARRAPGLVAVAVHPGAVRTRALAHAPAWVRLVAKTILRPAFVRPELGAMPALRLLAQTFPPPSGRFFDRFRLAADAPDPAEAGALWHALQKMIDRGPRTLRLRTGT